MGSDDVSYLLVTIVIAGIFGLFVGSFLNVVVYRAPLGLSVSSPRSFCPTCKRQLTWWENIPVASWIAPQGSMPNLPPLDLTSLSPGRARHRDHLRAGHVGVARHVAVRRLLLPCRSMIAVSLIEYDGQRAPLSSRGHRNRHWRW